MWTVLGHSPAVQFLTNALASGRLAHAYLVVGPEHVGKGTLAMNLAQAVNCEGESPDGSPCGTCRPCRRIAGGLHADVQVLRLQGEEGRKEIPIDQVRDLQHQANLKPYEGRCRVFIIDPAERLSEEAANCLLKTLEEPPPQVLLLLLTVNEEALLPTLRSRCQRLELRPVPEQVVLAALAGAVEAGQAQKLARLAQGRIGYALQMAKAPSILEARAESLERLLTLHEGNLEERFAYAAELAANHARNRNAVREALALWLSWWRDLLHIQEGAGEAVLNGDQASSLEEGAGSYNVAQTVAMIRALLQTQQYLDLNVNPRLALESLMLAVPGGTATVHGVSRASAAR